MVSSLFISSLSLAMEENTHILSRIIKSHIDKAIAQNLTPLSNEKLVLMLSDDDDKHGRIPYQELLLYAPNWIDFLGGKDYEYVDILVADLNQTFVEQVRTFVAKNLGFPSLADDVTPCLLMNEVQEFHGDLSADGYYTINKKALALWDEHNNRQDLTFDDYIVLIKVVSLS